MSVYKSHSRLHVSGTRILEATRELKERRIANQETYGNVRGISSLNVEATIGNLESYS